MHLQSSSPALHRGREWGSLLDRVIGDKTAVSAPQTHEWSNAYGVGEVDEYLVIVAKLAGDNLVRVHDSHMVSRFLNMLRSTTYSVRATYYQGRLQIHPSSRLYAYLRHHRPHFDIPNKLHEQRVDCGYRRMIGVWCGVGRIHF